MYNKTAQNRSLIDRAVGICALALIALAAWWSVRLARADQAFRTATPEGVARALALLPRSSDYLLFQALQDDYEGSDPVPILQRAAAAGPRSSAPRIQLGLEMESRGDFVTAESWLLDAARVDHQYEPAWTLANFYFRRGDAEQFWKWMGAALQVSYGDLRLAFDLCWRQSSDPHEILQRAIPDRREVVASYVYYLLRVHPRPEALAGAAMKLAAWHNPEDASALLAASDALIAAGRIEEAADLWEATGQPRPNGVTHPDFEAPRTGQGFDWRWSQVTGVAHVALDAAHRITLNGQQPESCELLRQTVRLRPGKYVLRWEARTQGFKLPTGVTWARGIPGELSASSDWTPSQAVFRNETDSLDLVLLYHRPTGEARAEGWMELRHVAISPAP